MRVTSKYLIKWVNDKFKELEINEYECCEVIRTHFTSDQYESGACFLYIKIREVENHDICNKFLCFYPMYSLQYYLDNGYELFLDFSKQRTIFISLTDIEINVRKK